MSEVTALPTEPPTLPTHQWIQPIRPVGTKMSHKWKYDVIFWAQRTWKVRWGVATGEMQKLGNQTMSDLFLLVITRFEIPVCHAIQIQVPNLLFLFRNVFSLTFHRFSFFSLETIFHKNDLDSFFLLSNYFRMWRVLLFRDLGVRVLHQMVATSEQSKLTVGFE